MKAESQEELLAVLQARFEENPQRHPTLAWRTVQARLRANPAKLANLAQMEATGGEPDVIGVDSATSELIFCDCATQSPADRRSLCYDRAAWEARKANKPQSSAQEMAAEMGVSLLTEDEYRALQKLGEFDTKTSSWVQTPAAIRERGGALFCDRRYDHIFTYHNGADSYYAARGFRGSLRV